MRGNRPHAIRPTTADAGAASYPWNPALRVRALVWCSHSPGRAGDEGTGGRMAGEEHDVARVGQQAPTACCTRCGARVPLTLAGPFPGCRHCGNTQPLSDEIAAKVSAVRGRLEQRASQHCQMTGRLVAKAAGFHGMPIAILITTRLPFCSMAVEFALSAKVDEAAALAPARANRSARAPGSRERASLGRQRRTLARADRARYLRAQQPEDDGLDVGASGVFRCRDRRSLSKGRRDTRAPRTPARIPPRRQP